MEGGWMCAWKVACQWPPISLYNVHYFCIMLHRKDLLEIGLQSGPTLGFGAPKLPPFYAMLLYVLDLNYTSHTSHTG